ncbi:MipA/OmpV family protein [Thalassotalea hakodatensis]|uniref:MipA/OmpV family protein n=1 Tax=Thalassotalea hakodatensis TaxID=3030492 RepID=UPI00257379CA|nr:MipA/OmpV family protein [Thalassotalea hakodatensis]
MRSLTCFILLILLIFVSTNSYSTPKNKPIFEYGAGVFALSTPQYAGAQSRKNYLVPLPYFYYQNEHIKVNREGLLGRLWQLENITLDFSFSANIPVESAEVDLRKGMPDIDWTFQAGPAIKYYLTGKQYASEKSYLEIFSRKVLMTDFSYIDDAGWQYGASYLAQSLIENKFNANVTWQNRLTVNFATDDFHQLYYGVDKKYQSNTRQAFTSQGGYLHTSISSGVVYRKGSLWLAGFMMYRNLHGMRNEKSPLVERKDSMSIGVGIAWIMR